MHNSSETRKDDNRLMQSRLDKLKDIRKQKNTNQDIKHITKIQK